MGLCFVSCLQFPCTIFTTSPQFPTETLTSQNCKICKYGGTPHAGLSLLMTNTSCYVYISTDCLLKGKTVYPKQVSLMNFCGVSPKLLCGWVTARNGWLLSMDAAELGSSGHFWDNFPSIQLGFVPSYSIERFSFHRHSFIHSMTMCLKYVYKEWLSWDIRRCPL